MVKVTKNYLIHFVSPYDSSRKLNYRVKHEKKDSLPEIIELINKLPKNDNQIHVRPEVFVNKHSRKNTALLKSVEVQDAPATANAENSGEISIEDQILLSPVFDGNVSEPLEPLEPFNGNFSEPLEPYDGFDTLQLNNENSYDTFSFFDGNGFDYS